MFDDRLATVLRMRTDSYAGKRTQFRQLLDLLGTSPATSASSAVVEAAYSQLEALQADIPSSEQTLILRESGLRLRNARLVASLAEGEPRAAASAMANARLTENEWQALIPALPVAARGFLRHRRDLPPAATKVLQQLGVGDLTLPDHGQAERPAVLAEVPVRVPALAPANAKDELVLHETDALPEAANDVTAAAPTGGSAVPPQISAILERIERYRESREAPVLAPRLPLGDADLNQEPARVTQFDVVTDAEGRAIAVSDPVAPWITGMLLTAPRCTTLVSHGEFSCSALRHHQPLHLARLRIDAAREISGDWRIDAVPIFAQPRGNFAGYRCRLRRPAFSSGQTSRQDTQADRMRELLHELRTPVGAIQGFAEVIQQQVFGPAPHEYRAHAAAISVDTARLLAGFEEIDRLAKLETGAQQLAAGECDFGAVLTHTLERLEGVLAPRNAAMDLAVTDSPCILAISEGEAQALAWRILATFAGAIGPNERLTIHLRTKGAALEMCADMPPPLREDAEKADAGKKRRAAVSAGMFGPKFTFRLARAEAEAAGGSLKTTDQHLTLTLPILTRTARNPSSREELAQG